MVTICLTQSPFRYVERFRRARPFSLRSAAATAIPTRSRVGGSSCFPARRYAWAREVSALLSDVATQQDVGTSTQTQTPAASRICIASAELMTKAAKPSAYATAHAATSSSWTPDVEHGEKNIGHASQRA